MTQAYRFTGGQQFYADGVLLKEGDVVELSEYAYEQHGEFFEPAEDADADADASTEAEADPDSGFRAGGDEVSGENADSDSDAPFDPSSLTVDEFEEALENEEYSDSDLDALASAEEDGKDREGVQDAIESHR